MKNYILLLLLATFGMHAQTYQNPTYGKLKLKTNTESTTAEKVNVQETDGTLNWQFIKDFQNNKPYFSTGLLKNGLLTINADNTKFDLSAGIGVYSDFSDPENVTSKVFNFPAFNAVVSPYLATSNITYVAVNYNGGSPVLVMQAAPFSNTQMRDLVVVGAVIHSNFTTINTINNISSPSNDVGNSVADLFNFLGARNQEGNVYSANGANLQLNKSAGVILKYGANFHVNSKNPHNVSLPEQLSLTFRYRLQGGFEGTDRINVDTDNYDSNNVLTTVPPAKPYQIQTIFIPQTGLTRIQYGQTTYNTLADAVAAINTRKFVTETNLAAQFVKVAYLVVKKGATSLQVVADADIIQASKFDATASGGVAITYQSIIDALGFTPENVVNKVTSLASPNNITYPTTQLLKDQLNLKANLNNPTFTNKLQIATNPVGSITNHIAQTMGTDDFWIIYGAATEADKGIMAFEVGNNGTGIADGGQSFEFRYSAATSGTPKTVMVIDYNDITANANISATSLKKTGATTTNLLLAGGNDISQLSLPISTVTQTALDLKLNISDSSQLLLFETTWVSGTQVFTLPSNYFQVYSVVVQGVTLKSTQYTLNGTNQVTITDILDSGDFVRIIYGTNASSNSAPYYTQAQVDSNLNLKANISSPMFAGTPIAPTAAPGTNTNQIATMAALQTATARNYKKYVALLSQSGTSAPTATVLENTLGGTVVLTRSNVGTYIGTLTGAFTIGKTLTLGTPSTHPSLLAVNSTSVNNFTIVTENLAGTLSDDLLFTTSIEIRVYN